ncbi:MAG TPA: HWE histidine kinase domain-containing protein, partial [Novosphingobium sp.]|nr:HWE histidine kinase domain-containing protein [Novosphingobium sp.]
PGAPPEAVVGTSAAQHLSAKAIGQIRDRLPELASTGVDRLFGVDLVGDGRLFDLAAYRSGRVVVLEIEAASDAAARDYLSVVRPMFNAVREARSVQDLCDMAARQMRLLTGFDRVKVYRFDETGAGEVVAEARADGTDSFLGLHFPASDIPRQARRLYTENLLRIIANVDDEPVNIYPALDPHGVPLDLSQSGMRAVSPIHIEYLRNMGVKASMSVSIVRNGELWGLFACHHYAPRALPYGTRTAAELFGEFFSATLEQMETRASLRAREVATRLHDNLMAQVAHNQSLLAAFDTFSDLIHEAIPFDGIVGFVEGEFMSRGATPDSDSFLELARWLNTTGTGACWATSALVASYPPAEAYAQECAGLLCVPVSRTPRDYIVLFRREYAHEVHWAGQPRKEMQSGPLGDRLTPRKSFALWKEDKRHQSRPWSAEEQTTAESLRVTLIEVILHLMDSTAREREAAARRQGDLIAELNHRVRNSLNLISGLVSQSRHDSPSIEHFAHSISARIQALARAHDRVNATCWEPYPVSALIETEARATRHDAAARIAIMGPLALIRPSGFTTLAMVLHELMARAVSVGALARPEGRIAVTLSRTAQGDLAMQWVETGNGDEAGTMVPLTPFARAIVERSIPHEMGGHARVSQEAGGLRADFLIPAERVDFMAEPAANAFDSNALPASDAQDTHLLSGRALIVEDNVIIGLEAEDQLLGMGAQTIDMASNVARALTLIGANGYEFALLDINLGNETSRPVAEALQALGTPFAFTTGYGEVPWAEHELGAVPVVTKPFDAVALEQAISQAKKVLREV